MTVGDPVLAAGLGAAATAALCGAAVGLARIFGPELPPHPPVLATVPPGLAGVMSDVALRFTPAGALNYVSASCRTVLGVDPEELLRPRGEPDPDPLAVPVLLAALARLADGEEATQRMRRPDGAVIWTQASCHSMGDSDDRLVMLRDITRQRHAEAQLQDSNTRLVRLANQDSLTGLANLEYV